MVRYGTLAFPGFHLVVWLCPIFATCHEVCYIPLLWYPINSRADQMTTITKPQIDSMVRSSIDKLTIEEEHDCKDVGL
jgi:hypothetical protein